MVNKRIVIEGVDKCGKDLLLSYIDRMSNHKYDVQARGVISLISYAEIYCRDSYSYDASIYKDNTLFVYLTADHEDLKIRHKITNEPPIDIGAHEAVFERTVKKMEDEGYTVLRYNTTEKTVYNIAKELIERMETLC